MTRIFSPKEFPILIAWALHGFSSKWFFRDKILLFGMAFCTIYNHGEWGRFCRIWILRGMVTVIPSSGFNDWRIINHGATYHLFAIIATDFFADEERTYLNRTNTTLISCPAINYTIVTQQNIIAAIKIGHGQNIILQWHGIERKHVNTIKEIQRRYKNSL